MYPNANVSPMMAGANVPPNVHPTMMAGANVPPPMVAGVMEEPMPYYAAPAFGYGMPAPRKHGHGFVLIVMLFILLIIVGSSFPKC